MGRIYRHKNAIFIFDDNDDIIELKRVNNDYNESGSYIEGDSYYKGDSYSEDDCYYEDDNYGDDYCDVERNNKKNLFDCSFFFLALIIIVIIFTAYCSSDKPSSSITSLTNTVTSSTDIVTTTTATTATIATTTTATTVRNNELFCSNEVLTFFAGAIFFEQGDSSKDGQFAVAHVVLNRMNDTLTEEKLMAVLTAPYQFDSVSTDIHHWDQYGLDGSDLQSFSYNGVTYYTKKATEQSLEVARLVVSGKSTNPIGNCKYFRSKGYFAAKRDTEFVNAKDVKTIGANTFFSY